MTERSVAGKSLIVALLVTCVACDPRRIDKLEKQNQEILSQLHRQEASQTYELEARCGEEAKRYFAENWQWDKTTAILDYANHYNRSLTKCMILVTHQTFMNANNEWQIALTLADIHERMDYGRFVENHSGTDKPFLSCSVEGNACASEADFKSRVKPYMTN